jgi:hypothetical protein
MKPSGILILAIVAAFSHAVSATGETLTFQEGDGGSYSSTAATFIQASDATNFATFATLRADGAENGWASVAFVRFPDIIGNNPGQIPPGASILSASLRVVRSAGGANPEAEGSVHLVLAEWDELTVTGTNWIDVVGVTFSTQIAPIPVVVWESVATAQFLDVAPAVQSWAAGSPNWGVMFRPVDEPFNNQRFLSDDAVTVDRRPMLSVTFTGPVAVEATTWGRVKSLYR